MACAGSFWCPRDERCILSSCLHYLALPWGTRGFGIGCFGCTWGLVGVSLCICVTCVFGLSGVFRELLIGKLGCIWFYLV